MAVYLLHLVEPISHAQHYLGFAEGADLDPEDAVLRRFKAHISGTSRARLIEVAVERGIGIQIARIWPDGDRTLERQLKQQKNGRRLCPICNPKLTEEST